MLVKLAQIIIESVSYVMHKDHCDGPYGNLELFISVSNFNIDNLNSLIFVTIILSMCYFGPLVDLNIHDKWRTFGYRIIQEASCKVE